MTWKDLVKLAAQAVGFIVLSKVEKDVNADKKAPNEPVQN